MITRRILVAILAALLAMTTAVPAIAQDRDVARDAAVTDAPSETPQTDVVVTHPAETDPAQTDPAETDAAQDDVADRPTDRCLAIDLVSDVCCLDRPSDPRPCNTVDRPHDINYRLAIIRLIKAHEWEKLLRLLHFLGVI